MTLRQAIRTRANELGWTTSALADAAGIARPNVSNYLLSRADLRGASLDRLLAVLGWDGINWTDSPAIVPVKTRRDRK